MSDKFKFGDLVWARMKGYPYWPAQIAEAPPNAKKPSKKSSLWVYFFGSENFAWVESDLVDPYYKFEEKHAESKFPGFKQAVEKIKDYIAMKKLDPTYELELPPMVETNEDVTPKRPKKTVKRISKDSPSVRSAKKKRSSPSFEENGAIAISEDITDMPTSEYVESPTMEMNSLSESYRDKTHIPSTLAFGFMGLGVMGTAIVKNLIAAGHRINLWNRTISKCHDIKKDFSSGLVEVYETPCEVVFNSDVIFCCVSDAKAAGNIMFQNFGVMSVDTALEGKGYVEMTGIDAETSMDFRKAIESKKGLYLEAQLQGSKKEAEDANLVVLTAGDHTLFQKCQPCFKAMGKTAFYLGQVGYAVKMNMVLNLMNSVAMLGLTEAFGLAERSGLSIKNVLEILNVTSLSCTYLKRKAQRVVGQEFKTPEHAIEHMQKDIKLCLDLSNTLKQPLMMASTANEILKHARRLGFDGQDCSSVYLRNKY